MARIPHLLLYQDDLEFEVTDLTFRITAGRGVSVEVVPLVTAGRQPSETAEWDLELLYDTSRTPDEEEPTGAWLLKRGRIKEGSMRRDLKRVTEAFTLVDAQYDFREISPEEKVTHEGTDLERELKFLCEQLGLEGFDCNILGMPIARVDYTLDRPWMAGVAPYVDPFEPLIWIHPVDQILKILDTGRAFDLARTITPASATAVDFTPTPHDIVTRIRLTSVPFGGSSGAGEENFQGFFERKRTTPAESRDAEGNRTVSWQEYDELHEDEEDPERITRTVQRGSGQQQFMGGVLVQENRTEIIYADDFTRPIRVTKTTDGLVDLPYRGRVFEHGIDVEVEETTWVQDDPLLPRKWRKDRRLVTKSGIILYTGDVPGADAVQASVASLNGSVDTSADTRQRYDTDRLISTTSEKYTVAGDRSIISVNGVTTNWLRGMPEKMTSRTEVSRDSVTADVQPVVEYLPDEHLSGFRPRPARGVDASVIGRDWGVYIAERILARTGGVLKKLSLKMLWPDPTFEVGQGIAVDGFGFNMNGAYVLESIEITAKAARGQNPPEFSQVLHLVSP